MWKDPAPDSSEPNNWISVFSGPAWTYDYRTDQYYLHSFLAEQPDLNWRNEETREAMLDTLRFWLRRGVDGFRLDACHFAMKDPEYRSNPVRERPEHGYKNLGEYDRLVHLHDRGHPDIHGLFREVRAVLDEFSTERPRFSVGEIHLEGEEWAAYYGDGDQLHMPYHFGLLYGDWTAAWAREVVESQEAVLPAGAWPNYVLGNHDEIRIATRYGERRARLATLMLLTLRGTPTLYYGDELGMIQADIPPEEQQDPWGKRQPGLGRDGCRTPMQWTAGPKGGFHDRPAVARHCRPRQHHERGGSGGRSRIHAQPHPAPPCGPQGFASSPARFLPGAGRDAGDGLRLPTTVGGGFDSRLPQLR